MKVNFKRRPGVPGPPIPRLLVIFISNRPTDPISGNAFNAKRKKGGMALIRLKLAIFFCAFEESV